MYSIELVDEHRVKELLHIIIDELEKLQEPNMYNKAIFDGLHEKIGRFNLSYEHYIDD